MPASAKASRVAAAPISMAESPGNLPKAVRPTPMMATSSTALSAPGCRDGTEGVGEHLGAVLVTGEGDQGQFHGHADPELLVDRAGQSGFDATFGELNE